MSRADDDMRDDYSDLMGKAERGKFYIPPSKNVVLDDDVAKVFPDSSAVNQALRMLIKTSRLAARRPAPKKAPVRKKASAK